MDNVITGEEIIIPAESIYKFKCKKNLIKRKKKILNLSFDCSLPENQEICNMYNCQSALSDYSNSDSYSITKKKKSKGGIVRKVGRTAFNMSPVGKGVKVGKFVGKRLPGVKKFFKKKKQSGGYYEKYIKYKTKYLKLKAELNL